MVRVTDVEDDEAPTVLIVDNNQMSLHRLTTIFRQREFNVVTCEDGDKAVDEFMEATKRFAKACEGQDKQFIPHPTTWLNQQRWNDDIGNKVVNIQSVVLKDMGLSYE